MTAALIIFVIILLAFAAVTVCSRFPITKKHGKDSPAETPRIPPDCPYCGRELLHGYMDGKGSPLHWVEDGEHRSMVWLEIPEKAAPLLNTVDLIGFQAEAYYCPDCSIIIAPTDPNEKYEPKD